MRQGRVTSFQVWPFLKVERLSEMLHNPTYSRGALTRVGMREVAPPPKSRRTIGFLTIESGTPYQSALIAALAAACEEREVNLVVFTEAYLERDGGQDACSTLCS